MTESVSPQNNAEHAEDGELDVDATRDGLKESMASLGDEVRAFGVEPNDLKEWKTNLLPLIARLRTCCENTKGSRQEEGEERHRAFL